MNKKILLLSLLTLPCLATTKPEQAAQARTEMHYLWNSTGALTREYLIGVTHDVPTTENIADQLLANQEAIGNLFEPLYDKEKAKEVSDLLKKQATLTIAFIDAAKKNDKKAQKETETALKKNACTLSMLLDKTNPYLEFRVVHTHILEYLTTVTKMVLDRVGQEWQDDIVDYTAVRAQLHKIASLLGKALTDAFPKPKDKEPPPKPRVTVPLPAGTSLRKTS